MGDRLGELETLVLVSLARCGGTTVGATGTTLYQDLAALAAAAPSVAAIHVTLKRMEVKRLVRSSRGVPSSRGGRPQLHYRLTRAGAHALKDAERMWRNLWKGVAIPDPETLS
jgi:DNA-binding PadR family transcriptional regulator